MAHTPSRRRRLPRDESNYWLLHVRLDKVRSGFFRVAADLPDHDHGFSLRIAVKQIERVDKIRTDNGIAADSDRGRLPDPALRQLMHRLVSERSRARHNP